MRPPASAGPPHPASPAGRADLVARQIAGSRGAGGGHPESGGGRIPLASDSDDYRRREARAATRRFLRAVGQNNNSRGVPLVSEANKERS